MKNIMAIVIIILVAVFGFWYFSRPSIPVTSTTEGIRETSVPPNENVNTTVMEDGTVEAREFTVTGSNFKFEPKIITVKKDDRVRIIFKNAGGTHDFKIDEFNVATKQLKDGETETIEFVASQTGRFEYYCSIGTHRQMGMVGTLIVE